MTTRQKSGAGAESRSWAFLTFSAPDGARAALRAAAGPSPVRHRGVPLKVQLADVEQQVCTTDPSRPAPPVAVRPTSVTASGCLAAALPERAEGRRRGAGVGVAAAAEQGGGVAGVAA
jgi:hypothetical protein